MPQAAPDEASGERPLITVFGGTGFLGRRVVHHLLHRGHRVRVAVRQVERIAGLFPGADPAVEGVAGDILEDRTIAEALAGASGAVNAVSLYREHGRYTYRAVHVEAARRIAQAAQSHGIARLVHVSGIGANPHADSAYIRARGLGEEAVSEALPEATMVRPAVMFGPDDAFLTTIVKLLRTLPVYPLFGRGDTRLQPVHVDNVAEAIAALIQGRGDAERVYEFGGPEIFSYAGLLRAIGSEIGVRPMLAPTPYSVWFGLAGVLGLLPSPPITRNQVELMEIDTVASSDRPGLTALGINPLDLRAAVRTIAGTSR